MYKLSEVPNLRGYAMRKTRRRTKPTDLATIRKQRAANWERTVQETVANGSGVEMTGIEKETSSQCKMVVPEARQ
jgi:hypothetical protein